MVFFGWFGILVKRVFKSFVRFVKLILMVIYNIEMESYVNEVVEDDELEEEME